MKKFLAFTILCSSLILFTGCATAPTDDEMAVEYDQE